MDFELNAGRIGETDVPPYVVFAVPSLEHKVSLDFLTSYLNTTELLRHEGINHELMVVGGDPYLAKVRNTLATRFLAERPQATDFFFIDDDLGWEPEAVVRFIRRPELILAGIYPMKTDPPEFAVDLEFENNNVTVREGLFKALHVPTGFLRIKRPALLKLVPHVKTYETRGPDNAPIQAFDFFQTGVGVNGHWWGEDFGFCEMWRGLGGDIWVDPAIQFTHAGRKAWTNNLAETLNNWMKKHMAVQAAEHARTEFDDLMSQPAAAAVVEGAI